MKFILTFLLFFGLIFNPDTFAQTHKKRRVLFIGNSYTFVNNLPQLVADIALSNGDTLIFDSNCPGGYTFNNHFNDPITTSKIAAGPWHYVILQAQSQEPSFSPQQVAAQTLPYAVKLDSIIKYHNPCASTVFYETWGRKNGDASNCPFYPPVCTYSGMQNRLRASYKLFSDSLKALMAPVGEAFRQSIAQTPTLDLFMADQSHPSVEGSYLAALVFYETLFQKSVLSTTYNPGISPVIQQFLTQVAHSIFNDSLAVWNMGTCHPKADFTLTPVANASYQALPLFTGLNHLWYLGDGTVVQGQAMISHNYTVAGTYTVSHLHFNNCKRDSLTAVVTVTLPPPNGLSKSSSLNQINAFPNPFNERLILNWEPGEIQGDIKLELFSVTGQKVRELSNQHSIQTHSLAPGIYTLLVSNGTESRRFKVIKESN